MIEIFKFHGGKDSFLALAEKRRQDVFSLNDPSLLALVKQLREVPKKSKSNKYKSIRKNLASLEYQFPIDLFAAYGINQLQYQMNDLSAVQIPQVIHDAFGLVISASEIARYTKIRDLRNNIAHGKTTEVDLTESIDLNNFL